MHIGIRWVLWCYYQETAVLLCVCVSSYHLILWCFHVISQWSHVVLYYIHATPCCFMLFHITSHCFTLLCVTSRCVELFLVVSMLFKVSHAISCHVMPWCVISYHCVSYHVSLCQFMFGPVISSRVVLLQDTSLSGQYHAIIKWQAFCYHHTIMQLSC